MAGAEISPDPQHLPRGQATSEQTSPDARRAPPRRKTQSELSARIASAAVLGIVALLVTWLGGWLFALFWLAAGLVILIEWTAMTRAEPRQTLQGLLGAGLIALVVVYLLKLPLWVGALVAAAAGIASLMAAASPRDRGWAVGGFAYAAVIALVPTMVRDHPQAGVVSVLWMFAVVWTSDIAAYFTGRRFGGPKLWPKVSPKKTWSGFLGGLTGGALAGALVVVLGQRWGGSAAVSLWLVLLISAVASVAGQLGDLAESALKRAFDVKDSGWLIPGHGGVMDRLDAFWPVALFAALMLALVAHPARG
jgi:phosphatidate cytidylyltransferase